MLMHAFFWIFISSYVVCVHGTNSPTLSPLFSPLEPTPMSDRAHGKQRAESAPEPTSKKARGPTPAPVSEKAQGKQPATPAPVSEKAQGKQPATPAPNKPDVAQVPPTNTNQNSGANTCILIGDALQHLMSLGFPYEMSLDAIQKFGVDINRSVQWMSRMHPRHPAVQQLKDNSLTSISRGEAIQQLFALGYDFNMCTEAVNRFGSDILAATNWMQKLGVNPGERIDPAWRHRAIMLYDMEERDKKNKDVTEPPKVTNPPSNENSGSSKSAGKAPMLDPKTGKPIRHDSSTQPQARPPQSRPRPLDPIIEEDGDPNMAIAAAIQSLIDMGFDFDLCMTAVRKVGADVQTAASWILNNRERLKKTLSPKKVQFPEFLQPRPFVEGEATESAKADNGDTKISEEDAAEAAELAAALALSRGEPLESAVPLPPHIVLQLQGVHVPGARPLTQAPEPSPPSPDDARSSPITPGPFSFEDRNNTSSSYPIEYAPHNANTQVDDQSSTSGSSTQTSEDLDSPGTPPGLAEDEDQPTGAEEELSTSPGQQLNLQPGFFFGSGSLSQDDPPQLKFRGPLLPIGRVDPTESSNNRSQEIPPYTASAQGISTAYQDNSPSLIGSDHSNANPPIKKPVGKIRNQDSQTEETKEAMDTNEQSQEYPLCAIWKDDYGSNWCAQLKFRERVLCSECLGNSSIQKSTLSRGVNSEIEIPIFCTSGRIDSYSKDTYPCRSRHGIHDCICEKATRLGKGFTQYTRG